MISAIQDLIVISKLPVQILELGEILSNKQRTQKDPDSLDVNRVSANPINKQIVSQHTLKDSYKIYTREIAIIEFTENCCSYVSSGANSLESGASSPPPQPLMNRYDPYFDPLTPRNVTALVGKSAYLSCRVRNLGNKTVSWVRHRDIHILTVGGYTYTSDQRFMALHHRDNDEWTLQIKWAQKRDAGMYECQISTQPVRSFFVNLNVVVPTAAILGGPDLHVDKGSTINLTCTIKYSPEPPAYIFWYHHDEVISYDSSRGGVSVITEKGEVTTSYLLIQHAELSDSGKYSCSPSNADVASVRVHVLNGERPAAMQTGSAGLSNSSVNILTLMLLCWTYSVFLERLQLSPDHHLR